MKIKTSISQRTVGFAFAAVLFTACGTADLRTSLIKEDPKQYTREVKAVVLVESAINKQGLDKTSKYKTYQITGSDHFKGVLGKIGNVWDWGTERVTMRYALGNFDGQIEVMEGKKKGFIAGLQSWDYYEIEDGLYNTDMKDDKRMRFGLAAYHYFYELGPRLLNAKTLRYMGEDELDGKKVDKVWASWGNENTKDYDQYILWIQKENGMIVAATHTVRENYIPMSGFLYSSTRFDDFRNVDGIMIPFMQTVQVKDPKNDITKYVHQFKIENFEWDAFTMDKLRPNPEIKILGDQKLAGLL